MEPLLTLWVDDLNQKRIPLTQRAIAAKVRNLLNEIQRNDGGNETFNASKGWFASFKQRLQIHCIQVSGETASADIALSPPNSRKFLRTMTFHHIMFLTWMIQGCIKECYREELYLGGRKIGAWVQSITRPTYSAPWRECIRSSKIKATTGVSLRNSQSNERHSKISFASHMDFKQKGFAHATNFLRMVFKHFCHSVLQFCNQNHLPGKVLLFLDNAPGHPPNLEDVKSDLEVKTEFCPLKSSPCSNQWTKEYRGADKSLDRPTSWCILFDG